MSAQAEERISSPLDDARQRVRAAAAAYEELIEAASIAKERRDEAIVDARDEGCGWGTLAHDAKLSKPRVISIVGGG